jgi:hypothetical protein
MRTGESSPVRVACPKDIGGFPDLANWLSRWGERFEMVTVPLKVHYKSTPIQVTPRR